jgi:hypothetical protein
MPPKHEDGRAEFLLRPAVGSAAVAQALNQMIEEEVPLSIYSRALQSESIPSRGKPPTLFKPRSRIRSGFGFAEKYHW